MTRFCLLLSVTLGIRLAGATSAGDLARQIQQASLDPDECYRVIELNFAKEDVKIFLASGYLIFSKPIAGLRHGAVFVANAEAGDAEVLLMPPTRSERLSLATFTESPNLEEHFKTATFIFTDRTADDLLARLRDNPAPRKTPEMGNVIAEQWSATLRNLSSSFETQLVNDMLDNGRKSGLFYMAISGNQLGNFDLLYDPNSREQIYVGKLEYRDNRTYFNTWTSFASRSIRNGGTGPDLRFNLDNFRIDASIDEDLKMTAVTRATLKLKPGAGPTVPFSISENMRVTRASIDGRPVEVFRRESLRSNLISGRDNEVFLLVPEVPLDPAQPHEVELQHEGEVIRKAGEGVFIVNSRGTWYPRIGTEFASYDLTFRYPKNLTLIATGSPVDDRTDGTVRITRRKTDSPIRFAGFNLGDYRSVSLTQNGYKIDVYANRHLEAALQPKTPAPVLNVPPTWARPRRPMEPSLSSPIPAEPRDPAARIAQLGKDVVDALEFMTAQFGPPPIRQLAITPIPGGFGQGFPGLVYLSTLAYLDPDQRPQQFRQRGEQTFYSELLETHEVAHQWFGNMVIAAGYQDDWLMEALSNYSALLLLEKKKGSKAVDSVLEEYRNHLLAKAESGHTVESTGPITWGFRLQSSLVPNAWHVITYEKGTWIMHMLRRRLGDGKFLSMLHELCNRYRFSAISTEEFRELAQSYMPAKSPDRSLKTFFENWVYGTGIPSVKLNYAVRGLKLTGTVSQRSVDDDFTTFVPVEVHSARQKTVYWLATGADPVPFSIPLKMPPTKVALLANDCLITTSR